MTKRDKLRAAVTGCAIALAAGCQPPNDTANGLTIRTADPEREIEVRYREGEHALVLRAKAGAGGAIASEIVDERGHSMTQLASSIVQHGQSRAPDGAHAVPIAALMANGAQLRTALQLSRHGLRQLRDAMGSEAADAPAFRHLSQQTQLLRSALRDTRLALLQEWGSEARRHITMTPEEHDRFFAILQRQAAAIARPQAAGRRAAAGKAEVAPEAEIAALLGAERYAQYQTRRTAWLAPAGRDALEVVP